MSDNQNQTQEAEVKAPENTNEAEQKQEPSITEQLKGKSEDKQKGGVLDAIKKTFTKKEEAKEVEAEKPQAPQEDIDAIKKQYKDLQRALKEKDAEIQSIKKEKELQAKKKDIAGKYSEIYNKNNIPAEDLIKLILDPSFSADTVLAYGVAIAEGKSKDKDIAKYIQELTGHGEGYLEGRLKFQQEQFKKVHTNNAGKVIAGNSVPPVGKGQNSTQQEHFLQSGQVKGISWNSKKQ